MVSYEFVSGGQAAKYAGSQAGRQACRDKSVYYINLETKAFITKRTSRWGREPSLHKYGDESIYYIKDQTNH